MKTFDLVIVGGGLVGASFAAALRALPLRIALVDATPVQQQDQRLFGLNYSSCQLLKNIGLWHHLKTSLEPIHSVHISNHGRFGAVRLHREDVSLPFLGHVVPAHYIEKAFREILSTQPNLTWYQATKLKKLQIQANSANLQVENCEQQFTIQTSLVIGADGNHSTVRQEAGIKTEIIDYQQTALVTRVTLKRPHQQMAYERFTRDGTIAMLPLPNNECATIITAKNAVIQEWLALSNEIFLQKLQQDFGYRLGKMQPVSERFTYPLQMIRAEKNYHHCLFLLGNAAHALHPIAAQGFNLALFEVAILAEYIEQRVNANQQLTAVDLVAINQQLVKQQKLSIQLSHHLAQNKYPSFYQLGMIFMDIAKPIKTNFINRLLGRVGSVPSLLLDAL